MKHLQGHATCQDMYQETLYVCNYTNLYKPSDPVADPILSPLFYLLASAPKSGAFYVMKSDFVKGRQQLLEPFIVVHNKSRSFRSV
jgi:hypothetical protein